MNTIFCFASICSMSFNYLFNLITNNFNSVFMKTKYFFLSVACATCMFFSANKVAAADFVLYEGFDYTAGTTDATLGAEWTLDGWKDAWGKNGNTFGVGCNIENTSPLVVSDLVQSGNYYVGEESWLTGIRRQFSTELDSPLFPYCSGEKGSLGVSGTTIWMSVILRPKSNVILGYVGCRTAWSDANENISFGALGGDYYGVKIGGTEFLSTVPIVNDEVVFLVCKLEFGATNIATLYVNPAPGAAPNVTEAVVGTSTTALPFTTLVLKSDAGTWGCAFDELRMASTYALAAPSTGGATGIARNVVDNSRVYSNNGKIVADLTAVKGTSTVSIFDTKGAVIKTVQSAGAELLTINVANKGIYMVQVKNAGKTSTVKVAL